MTEAKASARARIQVTVELDIGGGGWSGNCPINQLYSQARRQALEDLERLTGLARSAGVGLRVINEPKVTAILVEDKP